MVLFSVFVSKQRCHGTPTFLMLDYLKVFILHRYSIFKKNEIVKLPSSFEGKNSILTDEDCRCLGSARTPMDKLKEKIINLNEVDLFVQFWFDKDFLIFCSCFGPWI